MVKRYIDVFECAGEILSGLKKGVLLTTKVADKVNSMTISWGTLGVEWNKPIFTAFVRTGRFTHGMLNDNAEFTVNIPVNGCDHAILNFCGTKSGRDNDKIAVLGLTAVKADVVSVSAIKELPLTLECRVVYRQLQDASAMPQSIKDRFYPQGDPEAALKGNSDMHEVFCGEIVKAYILDAEE